MLSLKIHQQNPVDAPPESRGTTRIRAVYPQNPFCTHSVTLIAHTNFSWLLNRRLGANNGCFLKSRYSNMIEAHCICVLIFSTFSRHLSSLSRSVLQKKDEGYGIAFVRRPPRSIVIRGLCNISITGRNPIKQTSSRIVLARIVMWPSNPPV